MMDFDRWFANQGKETDTTPAKKAAQHQSVRSSSHDGTKRLTEEAQFDRDDFEACHVTEDGAYSLADRGCICFTGCAPCSFCTHPGNPLNQEERDECWELDEN